MPFSVTCPNCQHVRQANDDSAYPGICPACGIAYAKWRSSEADEPEQADTRSGPASHPATSPIAPVTDIASEPWHERLYYRLLFMPSDRHESAFWGHALFYVIFFIWGWRFIANGIDSTYIYSSWLHLPNLAFHEYGHIMFSPFGNFMMYLGGSLLQILLPLALLIFFSFWQQDNFAASLMLWWCGQNFIDVSPYIADAPARLLPLVGSGQHDWWHLLSMSGTLDQARPLAWLCFAIGTGLIILSYLWGATLLMIELRGRVVIHKDDES